MTDARPDRRFRFGIFEADAATGELRRKGVRIKLNAQPFQLLVMLLDRPGELVTREDISRELWPEGTFVDFEHGVNSAINRIREALGDTAGNPRFVETLARRGYRFIAPLERIADTETILTAAQSPDQAKAFAATTPPQSETKPSLGFTGAILATPEELPKVSGRLVQTLFVLLQLMYIAFYVGALANLAEIAELFAPLPRPTLTLNFLIGTAAILIPVRAFVLSLALFKPPGAQQKFMKLWPFLLVADVLWALAPFLLLHHINFGIALACTTLLVYSPFAQRSLVLMGAGSNISTQQQS